MDDLKTVLRSPGRLAELLLVPYFLFPLISNIFFPNSLRFTLQGGEGNAILIIIVAIIYLVYLQSRDDIRFMDFKFKTIFRILLLLIALQYINQLFYSLEEMELVNSEFSFWWLPLIWYYTIVLGVFANILNSFESFESEIQKLAETTENGEFSYLITNPQLTEDSVFRGSITLLNDMVLTSGKLVSGLKSLSKTIHETAGQLSEASSEIMEGVEGVNSVATSMALGAGEQAESISRLVTRLESSSNALSELTETILKNASKINDITIQINVLSLNAGIEASRAGDYGRGFAVVAENIRRLAEETNATMAEMTNTIKNSILAFEEQFNEIRGEAESIAAIAEETSSSAEEVAATIEEITSEMEEMTSQVTELEKTSAEYQTIIARN